MLCIYDKILKKSQISTLIRSVHHIKLHQRSTVRTNETPFIYLFCFSKDINPETLRPLCCGCFVRSTKSQFNSHFNVAVLMKRSFCSDAVVLKRFVFQEQGKIDVESVPSFNMAGQENAPLTSQWCSSIAELNLVVDCLGVGWMSSSSFCISRLLTPCRFKAIQINDIKPAAMQMYSSSSVAHVCT